MSEPDPIELQRLTYQQGQGLRSADRRDQVAIEAQMRAWHNRAKHDAYGVSEGLTVELSATEAVIAPGLAYDVRGRELILQQPRRIGFPKADSATATTWFLLARYKETSEYPKRSESDCQCYSAVSPFLETPEFLWKLKADWNPQDGVPIASVISDAAGIKNNAAFVRPREHGLKRRRIVTGQTLAGSTEWAPWEFIGVGFKLPIGVQVKVDTSQSGFTRPPCYFAWLERMTDPLQAPRVLAPLCHIETPRIDSFIFSAWLPLIPTLPAADNNLFRKVNTTFNFLDARRGFYVSWLAVEDDLQPLSTVKVKGVVL